MPIMITGHLPFFIYYCNPILKEVLANSIPRELSLANSVQAALQIGETKYHHSDHYLDFSASFIN